MPSKQSQTKLKNLGDFEAALKHVTSSFDARNFPFDFLVACGKPATTISELRKGITNKSKIDGAVLQSGQIHIHGCEKGHIEKTIETLRNSPQSKGYKLNFLLASDGHDVCLDMVKSGKKLGTLEFPYRNLPDYADELISLTDLTPPKRYPDSEVDEQAARKFIRLYDQLMEINPDWRCADRQGDVHWFLARLIFCFFAEDTGVFEKKDIFTDTIRKKSLVDGSNTNELIEKMFKDLNDKNNLGDLPFANGGLFAGNTDVPRFGADELKLLIEIGDLRWVEINPDIFGTMIQFIADPDERSEQGMHYTSEQNIMRVLNPLFLDDLNLDLKKAGSDKEKLKSLLHRMASIRVFDPACGSGNFLVVAYKSLRKIESRVFMRLGAPYSASVLPLGNFRGIEYNRFPARIAKLALIIAQFQCDVLYRGHTTAVSCLLPLPSDREDWITEGNALRRDWLSVCPAESTVPSPERFVDWSNEVSKQDPVNFESVGGEVYICGNPPFISSHSKHGKSDDQVDDLKHVFMRTERKCGKLDYASAWFFLAAQYMKNVDASTHVAAAFVATSSVNEGFHVPTLWPSIFKLGSRIHFAYRPFLWRGAAAVSVVIVGLSNDTGDGKLYTVGDVDDTCVDVDNISPYLRPNETTLVKGSKYPLCEQSVMRMGNHPVDNVKHNGGLTFTGKDLDAMCLGKKEEQTFVREYVGAKDFINETHRWCLWIEDGQVDEANRIAPIRERLDNVRKARLKAASAATRALASRPHRFSSRPGFGENSTIIIPGATSEHREYLPVGRFTDDVVVANTAHIMFDAPMWNLSLLSSRLHMVWVKVLSGKLEGRIRYSNTFCWNTFPIPKLTNEDKVDMCECANEILLKRDRNTGKTIFDLYKPTRMPEDLRAAHERNDEVVAGIYIGRKKFHDDNEMLDTLFRMYDQISLDTEIRANQKHAHKSNSLDNSELFDTKGKGNL